MKRGEAISERGWAWRLLAATLLALLVTAACDSGSGSDASNAAVDGATFDASASGDSSEPVDLGPNAKGNAFVGSALHLLSGDGGDDAADAANEGSTSDAGDAASEAASNDAAIDSGPSVCGDGVRALDEGCDDGVQSTLLDSCSSLCETRDLVAYRTPTDAGLPQRTLGLGRHPLAGSPLGFAVSWIEPVGPKLGVTFYDAKGIPSGVVDRFGIGSTALLSSAPGLASLPGGKYAAVWTDYGADGDAEGIAFRIVNPLVASSGNPSHANVTSVFSQFEPDLVWTGTQLVVAWADTSNGVTGPDLKFRTFDATLTPTSAEQTLAATSAVEDNVALAPFAGGWAAAWREASSGLETIRAKVGSTTFAVGPFVPGPYDAPPALVELDSTHLLVVHIQGSSLRGAVLDLSQPGTTASFAIAPLAQGLTPPGPLWVNAMRAGSRLFVSWSSDAVQADPRAEETWLKEITWNGSALDLTQVEVPLPRWDAHRLGDQRFPALAPVGSDLATAWMDLGATFANEANGDVAVELIPLPLLRNAWADGGGL